jgi:hypothetical protein
MTEKLDAVTLADLVKMVRANENNEMVGCISDGE